jgi:hypothetical protein
MHCVAAINLTYYAILPLCLSNQHDRSHVCTNSRMLVDFIVSPQLALVSNFFTCHKRVT